MSKLGKHTKIFALTLKTTPVPLVEENPWRKSIRVFYSGAQTVTILSAQKQAITDGYPVTSSQPYENHFTTAALWIISSVAAEVVRVQEDSE